MAFGRKGLFALGAALFMAGSAWSQGQPIRIGALVPMSGPAAALGRAIEAGMNAAAKDMNQRGGILGRQVEVVVADDGGDPARGVNEARRLAQVEKVSFVLGSMGGQVTFAVLPVLTEAKVLQFASAVSNDMTAAKAPYYFVALNADSEAQALNFIDYAIGGAKVKSAAILADNTPTYRALSEQTRELAKSRGLAITSIETFDPRAADLVPQLLAARRGNPGLLWMIGLYPSDAAAVMKGVKEIGWTVPLAFGLGLGAQAKALLASMPEAQIPNYVAQNFVGWTHCTGATVGEAPIPKALAWLKDRVPDYDKQLGVGLLLGYDVMQMVRQVYTGAGTTDTVAAAGWIERNSERIESVIHKFRKIDNTRHFMIGPSGVVMAENPHRTRADGLSKRAGC